MRQSQKFIACHWTIAELTSQGACDRLRVLLLDSAHHHAEVNCFDHDSNSARLKHIVDGLRDLLGKPLLHLKSSREDLYNARQLGEPDNLSVWNVCDVSFPKEWKHVVLTHRIQLDISHHDHVLVRLLENGVTYDILDPKIVTS